jgi:hypothetical protein
MAQHVERTREKKVRQRFWWETPEERHHLEDLGMHSRILLKLLLKKLAGRDLCSSIQGPVADVCKQFKELWL